MSSWFGSNLKDEDEAEAETTKMPQPAAVDNDAGVLLKSRDEAIKKILLLCASKEVEVPGDLRSALLGEELTKHMDDDLEADDKPLSNLDDLLSSRASELSEIEDDDLVKEIRTVYDKLWGEESRKYECRVIGGSYTVTNVFDEYGGMPSLSSHPEEEAQGPPRATQRIATVSSANPFNRIVGRAIRTIYTKGHAMKTETKVIVDDLNIRLEAGKMYLVLGLPGSGKSSLLKIIADTLRQDDKHVMGGKVTVNGISPKEKKVVWSNVTGQIDQIDRMHPYLTAWETCMFAWKCRRGGSHQPPTAVATDPEVMELIRQLDDEKWTVSKTLEGLGLTRCKDTFVGDQTSVRGVSGGEKKRVAVSELAVTRVPIMCCDEISTGLDAATTFDIIRLLSTVSRMSSTIKIVSLLQPPPETVALFDELILIDSGKIMYAGPLDSVIGHFESLGYILPERTDVADWLLSLPTQKGADYLADENVKHLTTNEFKEKYDETQIAKAIRTSNEQPLDDNYKLSEKEALFFNTRYHNSSYKSMKLLVGREMLLWWRDKYQIKARFVQDLIMGIVAGTVFWQQSDDATSVMGILFQSMFFVSVGAMLKVPAQFDPRSIFYKQQDANLYPTWAFVAGRSLAGFPTSLIDGVVYGSLIYWFVGLSSSDGPAAYFIFVLLVVAASMTAGLVFSIFSATVKDKSTAQACISVCVILLVLFSGFTVQPDIIPGYWIWAYWINFFGWILRSLVINEYTTSKYDTIQGNGLTKGANILARFGFIDNDGLVYTSEWIWWGLLFSMAASALAVTLSTFFLSKWRFETGTSLATNIPDVPEEVDVEQVEIPFQKVNLTFKDIHYFVKASTSDEQLELLGGIDGSIEAGKMTALMGSSGAGKTTLMDCLSLRKTTGNITGDVALNGHPQDPNSFRRCTGYVEQFDVQSPALTIRETVVFSAKLRLEETDPAVTEESIKKFVDQTLSMLELTVLQDLQVGSDLTGGLSFEQRKRLSIAVELVANPSVIFLDEPTSGLDARAAGIVMRGLKRIALSGRAVCATIHQPSIAIFNSFDSLLLLKRGGEVVYYGKLGKESSNLIEYLHRYDATPKIKAGENPATWMLTCIGAGSAAQAGEPFDYVAAFKQSRLRETAIAQIEKFECEKSDDNHISFTNFFATSKSTQRKAVVDRVLKIYWRSPSYNVVRLMVSGIVALLFGSVFASQRTPENESDMNSRVTSIFITFLFFAVNAFNTVLAVFEIERNMFYRHKAAQMYSARAILIAFTFAEVPFIMLSSMVFCVCWYFLVGFSMLAYKFFWYYLFFTLNLGCFTFLGQMMITLVRDSQTAQGYGGLLISMTSLFTGVLIRPQNISGFWEFAYWLFPGHYVLEGLLASQFHDDDTPIEATLGSPYYDVLSENTGCTNKCVGTAEEWVNVSFGGRFSYEHLPWNVLYLVAVVVCARVMTFFALMKFNYLAK